VLAGRATREQALERYGAFSAQHAWIYTCMLAAQHLVGRSTASFALRAAVRAAGLPVIGRWAFQHYLAIAPPQFAQCRRISQVPAASSTTPAMRVASSAW
jgi:hypothetical protein